MLEHQLGQKICLMGTNQLRPYILAESIMEIKVSSTFFFFFFFDYHLVFHKHIFL